MRTQDFTSATRAIAASSTNVLTWNTEIPSKNLTRLFVSWSSTGATPLNADTITNIRVKANNVPIVDCTYQELRSYRARASKGGSWTPVTAILGTAATAIPLRRFTIPFSFLDSPTKDLADACQFPPDSTIQVEITMVTAANQTGVMQLGYEQTNIDPMWYPRLIGSGANIPAASSNFRVNWPEAEGIVEGFGLPTVGLLRARLVLGGVQVLNMPSQMASSANADLSINDSLLAEAQQDEMDYAHNAAGTVLVDTFQSSPFFFDVHAGRNAPVGSSFLEVATGGVGEWAGAANRLLTYAVVPLRRAS